MLHKRVIPILLLKDGSLVKTIKFNKHRYIGDPCNTVKIFNELNFFQKLGKIILLGSCGTVNACFIFQELVLKT